MTKKKKSILSDQNALRLWTAITKRHFTILLKRLIISI